MFNLDGTQITQMLRMNTDLICENPLYPYKSAPACRQRQVLSRSIRQKLKAHPMMLRSPKLRNGCAVGLGGVACILIPAVLRMRFVELPHVRIAVGFGEDAGGCNAAELTIAFDDAVVWNVLVGVKAVAVYQQRLGAYGQLIDGAVHGQERGVEDVDFIDFLLIYRCHGPGKRAGFDVGAQFFALRLVELLGIVEEWMIKARGQNDGRCEHGASKAATAGFIATGFDEAFGMVEL